MPTDDVERISRFQGRWGPSPSCATAASRYGSHASLVGIATTDLSCTASISCHWSSPPLAMTSMSFLLQGIASGGPRGRGIQMRCRSCHSPSIRRKGKLKQHLLVCQLQLRCVALPFQQSEEFCPAAIVPRGIARLLPGGIGHFPLHALIRTKIRKWAPQFKTLILSLFPAAAWCRRGRATVGRRLQDQGSNRPPGEAPQTHKNTKPTPAPLGRFIARGGRQDRENSGSVFSDR